MIISHHIKFILSLILGCYCAVELCEARQSDASDHPNLVAVSKSKTIRLQSLLSSTKATSPVAVPTKQELSDFESRMIDTLKTDSIKSDLTDQWQAAGWSIVEWKEKGKTFRSVFESPSQKSGRGCFVFQIGGDSKLVLQAPHRYFDTGTGTIVRRLVEDHDVRAACWNTVHRKQFDLAHRERHYINAFTRALIRFDPEIVVVQIHGFANEKQKGTGRTADVIVSDATRFPGRLARTTAANLKQAWDKDNVRLFPIDTRSLGGTTNRQAEVLRESGSVGFLHVELNKETREKLKKSEQTRAELMSSLAF